jgi:multiple sugar transport system substrate-binding protein
VGILAKNKDVVGRTDLADNEHSAQDPRIATINSLVAKGETPYALNFGATYNDPNGPWLKVARDAVYGDDVKGALAGGKEPLTSSLGQQ